MLKNRYHIVYHMLRKIISKTIALPDNQIITIETGKLATQADGSVVVRIGNAMILATVVAKRGPEESLFGGFPLSVDYQEKFAASGKIPGGFLKREGRLGDHEIIIARLVDRAIRPLFPKGFNHEVQINISLISADDTILPDAFAALAASAALAVSSIPFYGPISEVRVIRVNGNFVINPQISLIEQADINLIVAATSDSVLMVEGAMREVQESEMVAAIHHAHEAIKLHCQAQNELMEAVGVRKLAFQPVDLLTEVDYDASLRQAIYQDMYAIAKQGLPSKFLRKEAFIAVVNQYSQQLATDQKGVEVSHAHQREFALAIEKQAIRDLILNEAVRLDGRHLNQVRPIESEVHYLPRCAWFCSVYTR